MKEITFAMIKPDAIHGKNVGKIIDIIENHSFDIVRMKKIRLTKEQAESFYDIHQDKPFFEELISFITSGPVVVMALSKEHAITEWRNLMGDTDSQKAEPGTIRNKFGTDIGENAVHGSDATDTAQKELSFFFPDIRVSK